MRGALMFCHEAVACIDPMRARRLSARQPLWQMASRGSHSMRARGRR
jgi:hypothetical protein